MYYVLQGGHSVHVDTEAKSGILSPSISGDGIIVLPPNIKSQVVLIEGEFKFGNAIVEAIQIEVAEVFPSTEKGELSSLVCCRKIEIIQENDGKKPSNDVLIW